VITIVLSEWQYLFRLKLGKAERGMLGELEEIRNAWAHQQPFSSDGETVDLAPDGHLDICHKLLLPIPGARDGDRAIRHADDQINRAIHVFTTDIDFFTQVQRMSFHVAMVAITESNRPPKLSYARRTSLHAGAQSIRPKHGKNPSGRNKIRPLILVVSMRSERGYSATKHDETPAKYDRILRYHFGRFYDLNSVGNSSGEILRSWTHKGETNGSERIKSFTGFHPRKIGWHGQGYWLACGSLTNRANFFCARL